MARGSQSTVRVGNFTAAILIGIAVLFDIAQFLITLLHVLPVAGTALALGLAWYATALAAIGFGVWFKLLGVDYFKGKQAAMRFLSMLGTLVAELLPLVSALPLITVGVALVIVGSRIEDAEHARTREAFAAHAAEQKRQEAARTAASAASKQAA